MPPIARFITRLRHPSAPVSPHNPVFIVAGMVFFFVLFDGILSYLVPIVITDNGFSATQMGLILGSSSVAGVIFDFWLCRFITDTQYRRIFFLMFLLAAAFPLFLFGGHSAWTYILAMIVWGFYYDLYDIGELDFVGRTIAPEQHASSFGVLRVFDGLGYLLAPLFASALLILAGVGGLLWALLGLFFVIALFFFGVLALAERGKTQEPMHHRQLPNLSTLAEFSLWERIGKILAPVLFFTFVMNVIDATFWTIGPLISESLSAQGASSFEGGLFMMAYMLPLLFVGWFVGRFTGRFGKKRTAFVALGVGSAALIALPLLSGAFGLIGASFIAGICFAFAWPAINGTYADYVSEALDIEREISTLQDAATNFGYIVGPVLAGITADALGYAMTFSVLGVIGLAVALLLIIMTPRSLDLRTVSRPGF